MKKMNTKLNTKNRFSLYGGSLYDKDKIEFWMKEFSSSDKDFTAPESQVPPKGDKFTNDRFNYLKVLNAIKLYNTLKDNTVPEGGAGGDSEAAQEVEGIDPGLLLVENYLMDAYSSWNKQPDPHGFDTKVKEKIGSNRKKFEDNFETYLTQKLDLQQKLLECQEALKLVQRHSTAESQVAELQSSLELQRTHYDEALREAENQFESHKTNFNSKHLALQSNFTLLKEQLEICENEKLTLNSHSRKLNEDLETLKSQETLKNQLIVELQQKLESIAEKLKTQEHETFNKQKEIEKLITRVSLCDGQISSLSSLNEEEKKQNEGARKTIKELEGIKNKLLKEIETLQHEGKESLKEFQRNLLALESEKAQIAHKLFDVNQSFEQEKLSLQTKITEFEANLKEKALEMHECTQSLQAESRELKEKEFENSKLKNFLAETAERLEKSIEKFQQYEIECNNKLKALSASEKEKYDALFESNTRIQEENGKLKLELQTLTIKMSELQDLLSKTHEELKICKLHQQSVNMALQKALEALEQAELHFTGKMYRVQVILNDPGFTEYFTGIKKQLGEELLPAVSKFLESVRKTKNTLQCPLCPTPAQVGGAGGAVNQEEEDEEEFYPALGIQ